MYSIREGVSFPQQANRFAPPSKVTHSRIQLFMALPSRPPGKRTCFANPVLVFIIIGIIIAAIAAFVILRPNPSGKPSDSTASPASQQ